MAEPQRKEAGSLHPTLDSNFRDERYDQKNIFGQPANTNSAPSFGIRNSEKVLRMSDYAPGGKKREPMPQIKSFVEEPWQPNPGTMPEPATTNNPKQKRIPGAEQSADNKKSGLLHKVVVARALLTGMAALSWTGWLWVTVQLPFAIMSLLTLGLWVYSEETWWLNATAGVVEWFLSWFGVQIYIFSGIFFINWVITLTVGAIAIGGVLLQFLISLLHPLSGRKGEVKMIALCWCFTAYAIPGINMFPWIWVYIFVVMRYPK